MKSVDINCDMGEGFGRYTVGDDEEMIKYVSSINVACGFHAGDPLIMRKTVALARRYIVAVGAHPGFPDLIGFGRRAIKAEPAEVENYVIYQIGALKGFVEAEGLKLTHVKPHGGIYGMAMEEEAIGNAVIRALKAVDASLVLYVSGGSKGEMLRRLAGEAGLKVALEAFPDRGYLPTGRLAPRKETGAVINDPDEIARRAVKMASEGKVTTVDGKEAELKVDTLCFHGDNVANVRSLKKVRELLSAAGIAVAPVGQEGTAEQV